MVIKLLVDRKCSQLVIKFTNGRQKDGQWSIKV